MPSQSAGRREPVPNFEVIFAVASEQDPAFTILKELVETSFPTKPRTKLVVSGESAFRAQKINNQLRALQEIDSGTEVLVFVDSDVVARPDFLSYLVDPLADEQIGISTGYRFYIPFKGDWPSVLRSLWNRLTAWELVSKRYSFAWGGAMAIRRAHFEAAKIEEHWSRSADDDLSMTTAVKKIGLQVKFVPQCLVISDGDIGLGEALEWTHRQLILTKIYYPALWRKAMLRASILALWLLAIIVCSGQLLARQSGWEKNAWALGAGLLLIPIELFFLFQAHGLWRKVLLGNLVPSPLNGVNSADTRAVNDPTEQLNTTRAYDNALRLYFFCVPLGHLTLPWVTLYSLLSNRIRWRGIEYLLKSPNEILVLASPDLAAHLPPDSVDHPPDEKRTVAKEKVFF
jgi:hypothetical protein